MAFKLPNPSPFRQEVDKPKNSFADNSFFTDNMRSGFGAGEYGTFSNPSLDPQTYASEGMGEGIASAGDAIADAIARKKRAKATSEDRPDMTNKHEVEKPRTLKEGASPDLDSKIQTAKSRGNLKRAARLEGRQERRIERQTEGAERVKARQAKKTAKAKTRQENKTKKSIDTSVDGSNLQMKNDSPNKFLGGIAGAAVGALGRKDSAGGNFDRARYERMAQRGGFFGRLGQQILDQNPVQAPVAPTPVAPTADMSAGAAIGGGAMDPTNPFEGKTFQITPANMMGDAKPVFGEKTQGMAETAFGSGLERQMSMPNSGSVTQMSAKQEKAFGPGSKVYEGGNTAIYEGLKAEDNSPAASYENPKTVINDSHGYVARKAAEAFGQIGEKLIEKKKGEKDENE
jgi:hypothetical protein